MRASNPYRSWYLAAVLFSLAAVLAAMAGAVVREAQPFVFCFTMFGLVCLTRPAWDRPESRGRLLLVNGGLFLAEVALVCSDLAASG